MKDISLIQAELQGIGARWDKEVHPFKPPIYGGPSDIPEQLQPVDGQLPTFGGDSDLEYPETDFFTAVDGLVQQQGIDALAWYVSFHVTNPAWGIFIPISSLAYIEHRYLGSVRRPRFFKWQLAFEVLWEHELFHFATDYAVAQWEILLKSPCWNELAEKRVQSGKYLEVEEKLANAHMLRTLEPGWAKKVRTIMRKFIAHQPVGYNEAPGYVDDRQFYAEFMELTKTYIGSCAHQIGLNVWTPTFDYPALFPLSPQIDRSQCPLWVLHNEHKAGIPQISAQFFQSIRKVLETPSFLKNSKRVPAQILKLWRKKAQQLALAIPQHPKFQKHRNDLYSLHLNDNYRVHLRPTDDFQIWEAVAIGTHKEMGHG
jgi:hypothetical protein